MTKKTDDDSDAIGVERKSFTLEVKDETQGIVEAVFSTFGVKDHDNDWTEPGAFDGNGEVLIGSWGHRTQRSGLPPVGKGKIQETEKDARLNGQFFLDTIEGREQFATVKNVGRMQEWSYSYFVLEEGEVTEKMRQMGVQRVLKKLDVIEISPVYRGAGVRTHTVSAKSAPEPTPEEIAAKKAEEDAAAEKKVIDDAAKEAETKAQTEREAAELKANTKAAVEEFHRVQRNLRRLKLV